MPRVVPKCKGLLQDAREKIMIKEGRGHDHERKYK